jgi:cytidine deaminase
MSRATSTGPELFIGLIGALGSPLDDVEAAICRALERVGYACDALRLTQGLQELGPEFEIDADDEASRIEQLMDRGRNLRTAAGHGRPMAWIAAFMVRAARGSRDLTARHAYILRSLKHRDEVAELRRIYGEYFIAVAVHAPRADRVDSLAQRFAEGRGRPDDKRMKAEELVARDENEQGTKLGQDVRRAFPEADVFLSARHLSREVERFVDLYFGRPVVTPTRDEVGMFHAHTAAVRSGAMGRQVGAAITKPDGEIIATGCNEVPKAGGGQYWDGDEGDSRDFKLGVDQSDRGKRNVLRELLGVLRDHGKLAPDAKVDELLNSILGGAGDLPETAIASLTEFTRDVHAEGAALMSAARRGASVRRCTLFATTFPCHNCAKHIIAAGISRVVYREPYPKSYARDFYRDSIEVEGERSDRVGFVPFIGVAPRRYLEWFTMRDRKQKDGRIAEWTPLESNPFHRARFDVTYAEREAAVMDALDQLVQTSRSKNAEPGGRAEP